MNKKSIFLTSISCIIIGMLVYAYTNSWLLIQIPSLKKCAAIDVKNNEIITKKKVTIWFWKNDKWQHETTDLVWSNDKAETLHYLISSWLTLLDENDLMSKLITVEAVLLSPSQNDAYVSFDRYPFDTQSTINSKLMLIESLLKTISENKIRLQGIRFLVHHKPLQDPHLDFSKEWPITGFLGH